MAKDKYGREIPKFGQEGLAAINNQMSSVSTILDKNSGSVLQTNDSDDISLSALSEGHEVDPNQTFNVKKYDGSIGEVKGVDLKSVLSSGDYTLETPEETQLRLDTDKYGTGRNIEAAALGAARGLTFGASDVLAKESGAYTGDELRGIESANFKSSIAGEVVGAVAPAIASGGTSLVAKGAQVAGKGIAASEALGGLAARAVEKATAKTLAARAAGLTATEAKLAINVADDAARAVSTGILGEKAAASATSLMTKGLEKAGYAGSAAKNIANKMLYGSLEHIAPTAANLAVQGALQGAGRLVTEDVFGTAEFNAENLVAYAGMGALVGGVFGGAVGAGKALIPSAKAALSSGTDFVDSVGGKIWNKEAAVLNQFGMTESQLTKARAAIKNFDNEAVSEFERINLKHSPKNSDEFSNAIIAEKKAVGQEIGSISKEADEVLAKNLSQEATVVGGRPVTTPESLTSNVMKAADDHLDSLGIAVSTGQRKELFNVADDFVTRALSDLKDGVTATKLQEYAVSLEKAVYGSKGAISTEAEASVKLMKKEILKVIRAEQRALISEAATIQGSEIGVGGLKDRLLAANKSYSVLSRVEGNAQKTLSKDALNAGMAMDSLNPLKLARDSVKSFKVQKALIMGSFDKSIQSVQQATVKGLKAMAAGTKVVASAAEPSIVRNLVSSELAVRNSDGKKIKPKNEEEAYNNIVENANVAVTDPERVLQHSNRQTSAMFEHAPNTAAAVDAKYLQVLQFIASKAKKSNKNTGLFDSKSLKVSGFETAKMARYLDAISNPKSMLDKAAKGKLSREHVEVMENIFPEMHKAMKQTTLNFISKNETKLGYGQKLQLGLLLGLQAHESMQPANIQALQSTFEPDAPEGSPDYNASAVGDMTKASDMATDTQDHEIGD